MHGEAVAVGMALATKVSSTLGLCSRQDENRIVTLTDRCGLSVSVPEFDRQTLLDLLAADKKSKSGTITFICNQGIGMYAMSKHTPEELLKLSGLEA